MFGNKLDLVAFTTYPQLIFNFPQQIPADYYGEIAEYTAKPVAFTEMGWSSNTETGILPITATEQDQVDFIARFLELTKNLNKEFIIWSLLHDLQKIGDAASPWLYLGLKKNDGSVKPG